MAAQATTGGLIPEQVWNAPDIPGRELGNGRPSGSAMPLVWAHAEYLKLLRSRRDGRVFDLPTLTVHRSQAETVISPFAIWRFNHTCRCLTPGHLPRVEALAPARVRWSLDEWRTTQDTVTFDTGSGSTWRICPSPRCHLGRAYPSRSSGGRLSAGRGRISRSRCGRISDGARRR